jgi:ABC-type multidrug transport system fused ATPase/permease subunit
MALTAAFRAVLTIIRQSLLLRLQTKLAVVMTSRFLWRVMTLPLEFFTQRHAGDIASRIAANEQIARLLSSGIAANALSLMSVVLFAAAMAVYDVSLTALCVAISLINVLLLRLVASRRAELSYRLALEQGRLLGATVSMVRTIETIKASGLEDDAFGRWAGLQAKNTPNRGWRLRHHIGHGPDPALGPHDRSDSWSRRLAGHSGLADTGKPRGLPILGIEFLRAFRQSRELFRRPANHQGSARTARGCLPVPARAANADTCGCLAAQAVYD